MKQKGVIKLFLVYMLACFVMLTMAYFVCGEPLVYFWRDVALGFFCNKRCLYVFCLGWLILTVFFVYYFLNSMNLVIFCWEISVGKWTFEIGDLRKKKSLKRIFILVICVALLCLVFGIKQYTYVAKSEKWNKYPITHAMGKIDEVDYTNSLEAFQESYAAGQRVFEVDFSITSDNKIVCKHYWDDWEYVPTAEEFLNTPINGKYTPLSLEDCLFLLKEYNDIWIVTDTKYSASDKVELEFQAIMDVANSNNMTDVLDRMIIQIYKEEMYGQIKEFYDFPCWIFTLYKSGWDGSAEEFVNYCQFSWNNHIKYITMPTASVTDEVIEVADRYGIRIYTHTVNDIQEAHNFLDQGVWGIYTDEILMEELIKEE